jgi:predicted metal-dependent phosphoesterase TrpH
VHVLAYGFDPGEPVFAAKRAWILEGRVGRTRRMVERLRELGAPVDFDRVRELAGGGALGRPHVARAMVEAGVVDELGDAFSQDWIGTGGRAYVAKDAVTPTEAVELIHGAGGVAVLAHPSVHAGAAPVPEPVIRAMTAAGLDGLEVDHPDQPPRDRARWRALAAELGLETTGASDCHGALYGYRLGSERTPDAAVDRLLARA